MFDWLALGKIIWIDILLSGDNALVIAMACRALAPRQRLWGMILGAGGAVLMRILFTGVISQLMLLPYLKIIGGILLFIVAVKLLAANDDEPDVKAHDRLLSAIVTIMIADAVMSLDNVIAVAAAANGSVLLLCIGLAISIPLIVSSASVIVLVLNKLPILTWAGSALLGWIAGEVISSDPSIPGVLLVPYPQFYAMCGALFVLAAGLIHVIRRRAKHA